MNNSEIQKNKPKENSVAKASFWFTFCNVIQRGIQFLVTPLYTRLLLPDGYGRYAAFLTWCNLFGVVSTLSLSYGGFNKAMAQFENKRTEFYTAMLGLAFVSTSISALIYFIIFPYAYKYIGIDIKTSVLMFVSIYFQMVIQLWSAKKRYDYEYKPLVIITSAFAVLTPLIGVAAFFTIFPNEGGPILGYTLSNVTIGVILLFASINRIANIWNREFWRYALLFNIPLVPHYLSHIVLGQSDRLMIKYYKGDYYTGIYTLAYQVSYAMSIVSNAIENANTPWMYERIKKGDYLEIKSRINTLSTLGLHLFLIVLLIAPEIVTLVGSSKFSEAIYVVPPVAAATYLMFLNYFLVSILFYYKKNVIVMLNTISGAIVNVLLNCAFIPLYGYLAAAYTTVAGWTLILLLNSIAVFRKKRTIFFLLFDKKRISLCIIVMTITCFLGINIYGTDAALRWIALIVIFLPILKMIKQF